MSALALLFAQVAPEAVEFDWTTIASTIIPAVLAVVAAIIRAKVKNKKAADAIELLGRVAARAVWSTWETYTKAIKEAKADGKLTDEEKARAKELAFANAKASMLDRGEKLVKSVFKDGLDKALTDALEAEYASFRQRGQTPPGGVAPVAPAPANPS